MSMDDIDFDKLMADLAYYYRDTGYATNSDIKHALRKQNLIKIGTSKVAKVIIGLGLATQSGATIKWTDKGLKLLTSFLKPDKAFYVEVGEYQYIHFTKKSNLKAIKKDILKEVFEGDIVAPVNLIELGKVDEAKSTFSIHIKVTEPFISVNDMPSNHKCN